MKKEEEILKLIKNIEERLKSENIKITTEKFLSKIKDVSFNNKYALWTIQRYLDSGIQRYEDFGRTEVALSMYHRYKNKVDVKNRNIMNIKTLLELEDIVEPFFEIERKKQKEKEHKEQIWSEIETIYEGPEGKIYVPKTKEASVFLGQGTRWCTASEKHNMFENYNSHGPLYVLVTNDKDENGREIKYQFHFETNQFMDAKDSSIHNSIKNNSAIKKLIYSVQNTSFFEKILNYYFLYGRNTDKEMKKLEQIFGDIFTDKFKDFYQHTFETELVKNEKSDEEKTNQKEINHRKIFGNKLSEVRGLLDEKHKTYEVCCDYVCKNGMELEYVPHDLIDEKICVLALENNIDSFYFVPEIFWNCDSILDIIADKPELTLLMKKDFLTKDFFLKMMKKNDRFFIYMPDEFKDRQICEDILSKKGEYIYSIPQNFKNKKIYDIAFENNNLIFKTIPEQYIDVEMCKKFISKYPSHHNAIPEKLKNLDFIEHCVSQNINIKDFVRKDQINNEIAHYMVMKHNTSLEKLLNNGKVNITDEMIIHSFAHNTHQINEKQKFEICILKKENHIEIMKKIIEKNPAAFALILKNFSRGNSDHVVELKETALTSFLKFVGIEPSENYWDNIKKIINENLYKKYGFCYHFSLDIIKISKEIFLKNHENISNNIKI